MRVRIIELPSEHWRSDISVDRSDTGPFELRGTGALERDVAVALESVFGKRRAWPQ